MRRCGRNIDANAGQDMRQSLDILLRIAGADAKRVQFHDLARVILVDMPGGILRIVEIAQHGRMAQRRLEKIAEMPERMCADRIFIIADHRADVGLVLMHIEMIEPEPGHHLA